MARSENLDASFARLTPEQQAEVRGYEKMSRLERVKARPRMSAEALAYIDAVPTQIIHLPVEIPKDIQSRSLEQQVAFYDSVPDGQEQDAYLALSEEAQEFLVRRDFDNGDLFDDVDDIDQENPQRVQDLNAFLGERLKNGRPLTKIEKRLLVGFTGLLGISFISLVLMLARRTGYAPQYAELLPTATRGVTLTLTPAQTQEFLTGTPIAAIMEATSTPIPTDTLVPTDTETPTETPTEVPTQVPTLSETATTTPRPRVEGTLTPTPSNTLENTATPKLRPTSTPSLTPTPTVTKTEKPTFTPTKTATPTAVPGVPKSSYLIQPSRSEDDADVNREGVSKVEDVAKFEKSMRDAIRTGGVLPDGGINFVAQQMSAGIGPKIFTDHSPNYWKKNGLGFTGDESFFGSDDTLRGKVSGGAFTLGKDGIGRLFGLTTVENFENFTALAAISAKLQSAGMTGKSEAEILEYLKKPEVDADIQRMVNDAITSTGYKGKDPSKPISSWPGAAVLYKGNVNFLQDSGTTCITYMADAPTRTQQTEAVQPVEFDQDLEKKTPGNDETPNLRDSADTLMISVIFRVGTNGKIDFRTDDFSLATVQDKNPSAPRFVFPEDADVVTQPSEGGRLLPCGSARRGEQPVKPGATPTPGKTEIPQTTPTTPAEKTSTPVRPTRTPFFPTVTPRPTNRPTTAPTLPSVPTDKPPSTLIPTPEPTQGTNQGNPTAHPDDPQPTSTPGL